ncbi:rCG55795 [Rattus norvegicus]|uniref:RCG55795 n=1 Tax=Rattus norvegicus TaxID=10116 RepID=A6JM73_RAT|nr:rCG55795 [Rattus norvegicus]
MRENHIQFFTVQLAFLTDNGYGQEDAMVAWLLLNHSLKISSFCSRRLKGRFYFC